MAVNDKQAYITVKKARIARAGNQIYSAEELAYQGVALKDGKEFGVVYRPPEMLIKNKDKFANVPFVDDHTPVDVTPDNWKDFTIGFVGSNTDIEVVADEIWVTGDVIFYDRKAYDEYMAGKVELSASYDVKLGMVDDPGKTGYDAILLDIPAVNHVALCSSARAGHNARVLDSAKTNFGGIEMAKMRGGLLDRWLGKAKDAKEKFSKVLMDSVAKVHTLKPEELEKEIEGVMTHVTALGDSEPRSLLAGVVSDCFKNPVEVLAKKEEVSAKVDELYSKCQDADAEVVNRIFDSDKEKEDEKDKDKEGDKEKDKKDEKDKEPAKDAADIPALIEAAITKSFKSLDDSLNTKIDAAVKKALGLEEDAVKDNAEAKQNVAANDSATEEDASYLVRGIWGNR